MERRMVRDTTIGMLPVHQTLTTPMADMPLPWQHLSPTGVQRGKRPLYHCEAPATLPAGLLAALPGPSKEWSLRPAALPWLLPITTHLYLPIVLLPAWLFLPCLLHFSSSLQSPHNFQFPSRGSKMIHLLNHPSTAWARGQLAPVLTCVHLPAANARNREGNGFGARWAWGPSPGSLCRSGQVIQPSVKSKHPLLLVLLGSFNVTPCGTLPGTGQSTETASLLFHWLLKLLIPQQR